jgi:hypothetical protein
VAPKEEPINSDSEKDFTHITLTDGKSTDPKSSSPQIIEEKISEGVRTRRMAKDKQEVKIRETIRNRRERMKRKGQACERCKEV